MIEGAKLALARRPVATSKRAMTLSINDGDSVPKICEWQSFQLGLGWLWINAFDLVQTGSGRPHFDCD